MELYPAQGMLDTVIFILQHDLIFKSSNAKNNEDQLTDSEKQQFIDLEKKDEDPRTLINLIAAFANLYNIYLYCIAYVQGEFRIINEHLFMDKNEQAKQAFLVLGGNNTVFGPLFVHDLNGRKQTVFSSDDMSITVQIEKYIEELNRKGTFYSSKL